MVKWEMDYLIFTKQPLTPANCMLLISADFSSPVNRLHVSFLLCLSAPWTSVLDFSLISFILCALS